MRRKRNVLIVASHLWIGGAESVIQHLAEGIDRNRFTLTVCCLKQRGSLGDELLRRGVDVVSFAEDTPHGRIDYLTFLKLRKLIRARAIEIVHTHTTHGLFDATLCSLLMPTVKVLHTFHFGNYPHAQRRILWMERICSRMADRLFAVGEVQRKQIQAVYGLRDHQIGTIYNGVPVGKYHGDQAFRHKVGGEHAVIIGTIATLITQKGLTYLLDVAKEIQASGRKAVFVIVGEGHLRAELEAKRDQLGLQDTVVFTGWVKNAADVALPAFDIFFQPSLWEAMSMVVLEAMAAGKPVVATRVGENGHILENGVDGLLVDAKDIAGMAAALERLIDDAALRMRLGQMARNKAQERFTIGHMVKAYQDVYESLIP